MTEEKTPTPAQLLARKKKQDPDSMPRKSYGKAKWRPTWDVTLELEHLRHSLDLTLREVADATDMSESQYWRIEQGGDLLVTSALRIASFYGRTVEEIWCKKLRE